MIHSNTDSIQKLATTKLKLSCIPKNVEIKYKFASKKEKYSTHPEQCRNSKGKNEKNQIVVKYVSRKEVLKARLERAQTVNSNSKLK